MKKIALASLAALFAVSAQASEYPAECSKLIDLTYEAAELMPEMKEGLGMEKEEMIKVSKEAWKGMSDSERKDALEACKLGAEQMKTIIDAVKASK